MGCEIIICLMLGIIFLQFLMELHGKDYYHDDEE